MKKEIDNLLVSQNLYSKNYKIDEDWENLINKYLKCRKLNKELADAFVDKVQVFEDGRISVNLVYDDCLEELLQVHCTAMNCNSLVVKLILHQKALYYFFFMKKLQSACRKIKGMITLLCCRVRAYTNEHPVTA